MHTYNQAPIKMSEQGPFLPSGSYTDASKIAEMAAAIDGTLLL